MASATTLEETQVSLPIKLASWTVAALERVGVPIVNLQLDSLKAKAEKQTGFNQWNDPPFLQDIATLINFAGSVKNQSVMEKIIFRGELMRHMTNYLLLQEAKKRHPDLTAQPVKAPLIIAGLPRTGTTLLQRLLAQDPGAHGPSLWELYDPVQVDALVDAQRRIKITESYIKTIRATTIWRVHQMFTHEADECIFMMSQHVGHVMGYVGMDYFDWFMKRSAVPDYQLHKQYLQALHYQKPQRHWVLKSPMHTPKLGDLLTVYPDAQIVFCHRSLGHVLASWASFAAITARYTSGNRNQNQIARNWLRIWSESIKEAEKARTARPRDQFFDVYYDELVADPIETVRKLYRHFGLDLSIVAEDKMNKWLRNDREREKPGHRYTLDQFGITDAEVEQAFGDYMQKYKLDV